MQSLLGEFYTKFRIKHEDLVSLALVYILKESEAARIALGRFIKNASFSDANNINFDNVHYTEQISGKEKERPDISGKIGNQEVIIIEAKFYAALTDNQPNKYLERLENNGVLMFICPDKRLDSIFYEISDRLSQATNYSVVPDNKNRSFTISNNETTKKLIIKSWNDILEPIKNAVSGNYALSSDINQLIGLKEKIDTNIFIPYDAADFSPEMGKKICSYSELVDRVLDKMGDIVDNKSLQGKSGSLMSTGQQFGYTRYFRMNEKFICALHVLFDTWQADAGTFFWFASGSSKIIEDGGGGIANDWIERIALEFVPQRRCYPHPDTKFRLRSFLPIFAPIDKYEDEVIDNMAEQLRKIAKHLDEIYAER
jgi:hypothetical protein